MIENNIVYEARLHWIIFFWPAVVICVAVYLGMTFVEVRQVSVYVALFGILWGGIMWTTYLCSFLTIKKKQLIVSTGFFTRLTTDIALSKVESIDIRQSILGSMLSYGTLVITGTGGTRQFINFLSHPLTCRRYIEQLMHD